MTPFWSVSLFWMAAVACVAIALAFVLPPLLRRRETVVKAARRDINIAVYRDQMREMEADHSAGLLSAEQFAAGKQELETRLAEDALAREDAAMAPVASRRLGFSLAAVLPLAAFGLYFWLGNPESLIAIAEAQANPQTAAQGGPGQHDVMKLIQQVEEKTKSDPNNGEAWALLAKTYAVVEHWPEALQAFEKAMKLRPDTPSVMTGYAEALAISRNRELKGEPLQLVLKALEKDPDDMKGLELAGIAAFQDKSFAKAAYYMKRLYKLLPPESPYAQDILNAQKEAERLSHQALTGMDNLSNPAAAQGKQDKQGKQGGAAQTVRGKVDLAPALKARVAASDIVFLFARSGEGGAPVAAIRAPAAKFPLEFELNDSMAMNPDMRLSGFKQVTITARVTKSGQPMGAAGDLEGSVKNVKVGTQNVNVLIDSVRK